MLKKFLKVSALPNHVDWAIFVLRVGVGVLMMTHGWAKFQRVLNGEMGFADPIGFGETPSLFLTIFAELFCSILLVLGLFTRPALLFLIITTFVIAFVVKIGGGLGEMEHGLLFFISYISLFIWGSGRYSLDYLLFREKR